MSENHLPELAQEIVRRAMAAGATDAECTIAEGEEFSAHVRMREIEKLTEAGSRAAGLRILRGKCTGSSYTSDLSPEGVERLVRSAIELADITTEDPHAGLPEPDEFGSIDGDLQLYSADVETLETELKIDTARRAEAAALAADPRIANSEGASFDIAHGPAHLRQLAGIRGGVPDELLLVERDPGGEGRGVDGARLLVHDGARVSRGWSRRRRSGRTAARRALRRLNPVKVETQKVPIVFEPGAARSLLDNIFDAVHGMSIYRQESFLAGKLGEKVASEGLTVVDDATLPGLFGTSPFDDEGVASRRTVVIERGVLKSYLMNTYAARKLGMKTTGNASRGLAGNAGIGHGNFYAAAGVQTPEQIIAGVRTGST